MKNNMKQAFPLQQFVIYVHVSNSHAKGLPREGPSN